MLKKPWYVRRLSAFDPFASKHAKGRLVGRSPKAHRYHLVGVAMKKRRRRKNARVARAITRNWPRGRS